MNHPNEPLATLTRSEAYYRQLTETIAAFPWEAQWPSLTFTYVGPRAAALLGYAEEIWYQPGFWLDHTHPDDRQTVAAYCTDNASSGHACEFRMTAAGGGTLWLRATMKVASGKAQGFMFDITAQKLAEQALRESEEKYRGIFNNAQVGLWRTRTDGRLLECNDRIAQMFGYRDRDDALAHFSAAEHYFDPGARDRMLVALREQGEINNFDARMMRKDGSEIWVRYTAKLFPEQGYLEGVAADISDEKQAMVKLQASEKELAAILNNIQDTYYRTDATGRIVHTSAAVERLLGYPPEEIAGMYMADLYAEPQRRQKFLDALKRGGGIVKNYEAPLRRKDGQIVWVSTNAQYYRDENGKIDGVEGTTRDVSERREADARMRTLSSALEQTADTVIVANRDGVIEYVNPAFEAVTGYSKEEAIGRPASILKSGQHDKAFYKRLWKTILGGGVFQEVFVNRKKDGGLFYEEKAITPVKDECGNLSHFVSTGKDITERMQTQQRLQYLAHHDVLTTLPNRALFADRLEHALARTRQAGTLIAVLFLDLDRFKIINDTLGHDTGDRVLESLSQQLLQCVRKSDTVARLGGDEFAVILEDFANPDSVAAVAHKILDVLGRPFEVDGREFFITTSIGISMFPSDGDDPHTLLKHADIAMYQAKEHGRNTYRFYSADMSARVFQRLSLETSLRHALERNELVLYYQPQTDVAGGGIIGVEALLRWQHSDLGLVSPLDFVPILEETGLILDVGEWVLRSACRQIQAWRAAGYAPLRLAVNLSSRQFNAPGLPAMLECILNETGLVAGDLELEITESILVQHSEETMDTFRALADLGVRLAIDDFGTGYSSLSYLKRFSIDTIKIDRSFVADVIDDPDDAAIVEAIIAMARRLDMDVIAEGVETQAQLRFLRDEGCRYMQGFLLGRPAPAEEFSAMLTTPAVRLQSR